MKMVRYTGSRGGSALYVDGKLAVVGAHHLIDAKIAEQCGVEQREGEPFMKGGQYMKEVAATLEEVEEYERRIAVNPPPAKPKPSPYPRPKSPEARLEATLPETD